MTVALCSYTIRIMPPSQEMENEPMDRALRTVEATIEYRNRLCEVISEAFVDGVDALGEAGFYVEVTKINGYDAQEQEERSRRYYCREGCDHRHLTVQAAYECTSSGSVRALIWAFGDFTIVGLEASERCELSKLKNPGWWDKHRPGWRDK